MNSLLERKQLKVYNQCLPYMKMIFVLCIHIFSSSNLINYIKNFLFHTTLLLTSYTFIINHTKTDQPPNCQY